MVCCVSEPTKKASRTRGRPRASAEHGDAKSGILRAAADEFAANGYDAASLRAIARRAGVDPALVYHYFDDKADLFTAVVRAPLRPDHVVAQILAGPREAIGTSIVRYILEQLEDRAVRARAVVLIRTALGRNPASAMLKQFLVREVFLRLAAGAGGEDAELRATLAATQILGMLTMRFVLALEPVASAPIDELVARIGPVVQWHLVGYPLRADSLDTNTHSDA
jgi:AcrR family transcriptional regulator